MIVYLHGFRSSPASRKAVMLRDRLAALGRGDEFRCPALPASPRAAAELALGTVGDVPAAEVALIGSSLGGYYATWLAERIGCRAVLLNPAITPARDLQAHVGRQPVYFSDDEIDFRPEYPGELAALEVPVTHPDRYFLLAATGDTVIDYRTMLAKYAGARQHLITGSNHELSDFASYIDEVLGFCAMTTGEIK
jgi:predicted esterase YcpF (UPF0227 family)